MKKILAAFSIILALWACSEESLLKPYGPDDTTPPEPITNVTYTAIPGGAKFNYVLPADQDLAYVKAIYYVNGVEKNAMASQYETKLLIEGLPDKKEYNVKLYAVDKLNNSSQPVELTITPEESPVKVMRESLECVADFGG